MGDATSGPVRLSFNPQLRVEFRGATVTSDAGLLLPRELDERLGFDALIERHLTDPRTGHNRQFPLPDLFRQAIYSRLAGSGYQRRRTAGRGSDVSDAGLPRAEGDERRAHLDTPLVRDGRPHGGAELPRTGSPQYGTDPARGGPISDPEGDARHRQLRESRARGARAVRLQRSL